MKGIAAGRASIRRWALRAWWLVGALLLVWAHTAAGTGAEKTGKTVYVVSVRDTIERGLEAYLERALAEAEEGGAALVLLELDTPGGEIGAADRIGHLVRTAPVPVVAYIVNDAFSAGTYIALNADKIAMAPGSAMGAATPVDLAGRPANPKVVAAWAEKMAAAAQAGGRDPQVARAMVDPEVAIPGVVEKGRVLSLSAQEALRLGYADVLAESRDEVLAYMGMAGAQVVTVAPTMGERIARWVMHPYVAPLLLAGGFVGLLWELLTPGHGLPGAVGLTLLGLYFFGHLVAGFADAVHLVLFLVGVVLLLVELFFPGFGVFGILGVVAVAASIVLAAADTAQGLITLGVAALVAVVFALFAVRYGARRGLFRRFVLKDALRTEAGYVAPLSRDDLVGKRGKTLTPLRPAGSALIEGERVDVVSEGGFLPPGRQVEVVKVEGVRVVVRAIEEQNNGELPGAGGGV